METTSEVLLIIVSSVLAIFLIIACVALLFLIKVFRKAAVVADSVESAATAVKRGVTAAPFIRLFTKMISKKGGKNGKG